MIFVILGSQKFQFNRLLEQIDNLIENRIINEEVFAQTGFSSYIPKNYKYKDFLNRDEFSNYQEKSNIVITHGGTGAIIGALKKNKKVIAVPRLSKYKEHVDNHQIELLKEFEKMNLICCCYDCEDLEVKLHEVNKHSYDIYQSNTQSILNSINEFINKNC